MPTKIELEQEKALDIPAFDLTRLNMVQIAQDLSTMISTPSPKSWLGKWFGNKKLHLDNNRISEISAYISRIRVINEQTTKLQAELYLSPTVLENLIQGHIAEAKRLAERQIADHEEYLQRVRDEQEGRQITLAKARLEIERLRAQVAIDAARARLLDKVVTELDLEKISPAQAFVLIKALNPQADATVDFASKEMMLNAQIADMEAATLKKRHEARRELIKADLEEHRKNEAIKRDDV